jgi:hypothetical protein
LSSNSFLTLHPAGLADLYRKTGLPVVAHNRYWAIDNIYSSLNGGPYTFVTEAATKRALPDDPHFWDDLFGNNTDWGLAVYEQDWQDRQFVQMAATHTDFGLGRRWLAAMGAAAARANLTIQYCMTLPRQLLQASPLLFIP